MDVVSNVSRAAAMVHKEHLSIEMHDSDISIKQVIDKYYMDDISKRVRVRLIYESFRQGHELFF